MARTQGQQVATVKPVDQFRHELTLRKDMFNNALPAHVPVEKFQANLIAAVAMTPKLLECDRGSLFKAAMTAAQLGLMVDPVLGHAYLVPYGNIVQCLPGYRGLIHLARQSGEVASLYAHEVYEGDTFDMELGTNKHITHKPMLRGDRGKMIGVYAAWSYSKSIDQGGKLATDFEYMTIEDIEAIRTRSKAGNNGPWKTDYVQMARKTAIRRAAKYLPLSVQRAAVLDSAYDQGKTTSMAEGELVIDEAADITDVTPMASEAARSQLDDLEGRVTARPAAAAPPPTAAPAAAPAPAAPKPAAQRAPAAKPEPNQIQEVQIISVPQGANGPDWATWVAACIEAVPADADHTYISFFLKQHDKPLKNCEFAAPDEHERLMTALGQS